MTNTSKRTSYTVLVCSCDAYRDAWMPLFTLLGRYWPGIDQIPIVLNTETATYLHDKMNIACPQLYTSHPDPQSVPWSQRLRETLEHAVDTDLVLIYLDDFYLRSPVDTERLDVCINLMERNKNIANVGLFSCPPPYTPTEEHPWLVKRNKKAPYLFNLQTGLWRKDRLLYFIRDHESPWYFERWGSLRACRYPDDFYAAVSIDGKEAIFDYWPSKQGLSKGLWLPNTAELFEKEHIDIDLSLRGIMPEDWRAAQKHRRNWFKSAWNIFRSLRP